MSQRHVSDACLPPPSPRRRRANSRPRPPARMPPDAPLETRQCPVRLSRAVPLGLRHRQGRAATNDKAICCACVTVPGYRPDAWHVLEQPDSFPDALRRTIRLAGGRTRLALVGAWGGSSRRPIMPGPIMPATVARACDEARVAAKRGRLCVPLGSGACTHRLPTVRRLTFPEHPSDTGRSSAP